MNKGDLGAFKAKRFGLKKRKWYTLFCLTRRFSAGRGLVLYPQIGDKMDIVCPRADASSGGREEFYRIYLVSRSQMESCTIDKTDTPLLNCDKPHQDVKFTFKFQEFSPNLWGLEFLKGKDYYITCECGSSWLMFTACVSAVGACSTL